MKTTELTRWDDFHTEIERLRSIPRSGIQTSSLDKRTYIFRGQADSNWKLETTWDRTRREGISIEKYNSLAFNCFSHLDSFLKNKNIEIAQYRREIDYSDVGALVQNLIYSDMYILLRHYGFPSPLLDWSNDPYVAAYFAFADNARSEFVSIYAYCEHPRHWKTVVPATSYITEVSSDNKSIPRHNPQKGTYTLRVQYENGGYQFIPHEDVEKASSDEQDYFHEIRIPSSERANALSYLIEKGITAPFLFENEDWIFETIAHKELVIGELPIDNATRPEKDS